MLRPSASRCVVPSRRFKGGDDGHRCLSVPGIVPSCRWRPLTTEDGVTGADAKTALERGRPVVLVCPPAPDRAQQLWDLLDPTPGRGPGVGPPGPTSAPTDRPLPGGPP